MASIITLSEYKIYDDAPSPADNDTQISATIELATSYIEKETGRIFELDSHEWDPSPSPIPSTGIYGNQEFDGTSTLLPAANCLTIGNWDLVDMGLMPVDATVSAFKLHGTLLAPATSITVVAHIYELDTDNVDDSTLLASSEQVVITSLVTEWHTIPITATLEANKRYGLALQANLSSGSFELSRKIFGVNHHNGFSETAIVVCYTPPDPLGSVADRSQLRALYVDYEEIMPSPSPVPETTIVEILNGTGSYRLFTRNAPVTYLDKLEYWDGTQWLEVDIVSTPYIFKADSNIIYYTQGHVFPKGWQNIRATFDYGYTTELPDNLKYACYLVTKHIVNEAERQGLKGQTDGEQTFSYEHNSFSYRHTIPLLAQQIISKYKTSW